MAKFRWTKNKARAAVLVSEDTLTNEEIAQAVGVTRQGLDGWKRNPDFSARVAEHVEAYRQAVLSRGIADRVNRVAALDDRRQRMQRVIAERAVEMKGEIAGADTGLLVRQHKMLGSGPLAEMVTEYSVDTGLLAELRAVEKQGAQEVGQWVEKVAPTKSDGTDLDLASLVLAARERKAKTEDDGDSTRS